MFGQHSQGIRTRPLIPSAPKPQASSTWSYSENLAGTQTPFSCGGLLQVRTSSCSGIDDM